MGNLPNTNTNPPSELTCEELGLSSEHYNKLSEMLAFYNITFDSEAYTNTLQECIGDYDEFDELLKVYNNRNKSEPNSHIMKGLFVEYISYAVPEENVIKLMVEAFKKHLLIYPNAKLIDLGCCTGVFYLAFCKTFR
jgi:hypothetical protein